VTVGNPRLQRVSDGKRRQPRSRPAAVARHLWSGTPRFAVLSTGAGPGRPGRSPDAGRRVARGCCAGGRIDPPEFELLPAIGQQPRGRVSRRCKRCSSRPYTAPSESAFSRDDHLLSGTGRAHEADTPVAGGLSVPVRRHRGRATAHPPMTTVAPDSLRPGPGRGSVACAGGRSVGRAPACGAELVVRGQQAQIGR